MRFSEVLKRLAGALAMLSPADLNVVKRLFRDCTAKLEAARAQPGGDRAIFDYNAFCSGMPVALGSYVGDFRKACEDEIGGRPAPWAARHLLEAIVNFIPDLARPLEAADAPGAPPSAPPAAA